jgi:hypothetical protein
VLAILVDVKVFDMSIRRIIPVLTFSGSTACGRQQMLFLLLAPVTAPPPKKTGKRGRPDDGG